MALMYTENDINDLTITFLIIIVLSTLLTLFIYLFTEPSAIV